MQLANSIWILFTFPGLGESTGGRQRRGASLRPFWESLVFSSRKEEKEPEKKMETKCLVGQEKKWKNGLSQKLREKIISRTKGVASWVENYWESKRIREKMVTRFGSKETPLTLKKSSLSGSAWGRNGMGFWSPREGRIVFYFRKVGSACHMQRA